MKLLNACLKEDRTFCKEDLIASTLDVTLLVEAEYEWQDGSTASTYVISDTGTYWVEIRNECFTVMDTLHSVRLMYAIFDKQPFHNNYQLSLENRTPLS